MQLRREWQQLEGAGGGETPGGDERYLFMEHGHRSSDRLTHLVWHHFTMALSRRPWGRLCLALNALVSSSLLGNVLPFLAPRIAVHRCPACRSINHLADEEVASTEATELQSRRRLISLATIALLGLGDSAQPTNAYDKTYPGELAAGDGGDDRDSRQRQLDRIREKESRQRVSVISRSPLNKPIGALLWGSALWFLSGSRNSPVITPLANLFYDDQQEEWLKDRNEGLFANLPLALFALLTVVFVVAGLGTDVLVTNLAEGNRNVSLQLAGVSLITGGALELGRIASGEKKQTRQETDRDVQLEQEFAEFAASRLQPGGSCHRNEVVAAFRRFYAKYRQADNEGGVTDLEVERLLRNWSRPLAGVEMSAAGFYSGIRINQDADIFVKR